MSGPGAPRGPPPLAYFGSSLVVKRVVERSKMLRMRQAHEDDRRHRQLQEELKELRTAVMKLQEAEVQRAVAHSQEREEADLRERLCWDFLQARMDALEGKQAPQRGSIVEAIVEAAVAEAAASEPAR